MLASLHGRHWPRRPFRGPFRSACLSGGARPVCGIVSGSPIWLAVCLSVCWSVGLHFCKSIGINQHPLSLFFPPLQWSGQFMDTCRVCVCVYFLLLPARRLAGSQLACRASLMHPIQFAGLSWKPQSCFRSHATRLGSPEWACAWHRPRTSRKLSSSWSSLGARLLWRSFVVYDASGGGETTKRERRREREQQHAIGCYRNNHLRLFDQKLDGAAPRFEA